LVYKEYQETQNLEERAELLEELLDTLEGLNMRMKAYTELIGKMEGEYTKPSFHAGDVGMIEKRGIYQYAMETHQKIKMEIIGFESMINGFVN